MYQNPLMEEQKSHFEQLLDDPAVRAGFKQVAKLSRANHGKLVTMPVALWEQVKAALHADALPTLERIRAAERNVSPDSPRMRLK